VAVSSTTGTGKDSSLSITKGQAKVGNPGVFHQGSSRKQYNEKILTPHQTECGRNRAS
jgi:hypothetical protein